MIFAKLDVTLAYHPKAHKAGKAMATWAWALAYSREQELDGAIPREALRLSWVGETQATEDCARLVAVGLFVATDDGWSIAKYDKKNETKAVIDEKRRSDRQRKRSDPPPGFRPDSDRNPSGKKLEMDGNSPGFPGSLSGSRSGSQEGVQGEELLRTSPLADDARGVYATIDMNRPVGLAVEVVWSKFCGQNAGEMYPSRERLLGRWQKWVEQQASFAAGDRERERKRQDATAERARFAREGPPKPPPPTQAQAEAMAEELAARVRAARASGAVR